MSISVFPSMSKSLFCVLEFLERFFFFFISKRGKGEKGGGNREKGNIE